MNQLTYFIIDDLQSILEISEHLKKFPSLKLIGSAQNVADGLEFFLTYQYPEILFINFDFEDSLTFLVQDYVIREGMQIILLSNDHLKAIKGFELGVIDYLLKPADPFRLSQSVQRSSSLSKKNKEAAYCFLQTEVKGKMVKMVFADVCYIEVYANNYIKITLNNKTSTVSHTTLKNLAYRLNHKFVRIHRATIVNLDAVIEVTSDELIMADGRKLKIGPNYQEPLRSLLSG
jgi:two-component system LytT family response regulator